jgi:hypothetical protein
MTDMIPRAEADARVAAACEAMRQMALDIAHEHLARVQPHDPDDPHPVDKVAQGYGNAAINISAAIRALTPDHARAALNQMIADAVNEATKLTVPIAALDTMLAEAEKRAVAHLANCRQCGRIVDTREVYQDGDDFGCEMNDGSWVCSGECYGAAIRAEAGE